MLSGFFGIAFSHSLHELCEGGAQTTDIPAGLTSVSVKVVAA